MAEKVVVVTGAGRGIGRAVCEKFASEGARVIAASRTEAELAETKVMVEKAGGSCTIAPTDMTDPDAIGILFGMAKDAYGRVDVLVNNAGTAEKKPFDKMTLDEGRMMIDLNCTAVMTACYQVWPIMKRQGGGTIVNISSMASLDPFPGFAVYGATKAWVNTFTKGLAAEGREFGIGVFSVAPGAVSTRMQRELLPDFPAEKALDPEDVAELVYAVTQPASQYSTGETISLRK